MRVLWVGDAIAPSGFARVTHAVLDRLAASTDHEYHVLGINWEGGPYPDLPYKVWCARRRGDALGRDVLEETVRALRPDVVVLFHDLWVARDWWAPRGLPASAPGGVHTHRRRGPPPRVGGLAR